MTAGYGTSATEAVQRLIQFDLLEEKLYVVPMNPVNGEEYFLLFTHNIKEIVLHAITGFNPMQSSMSDFYYVEETIIRTAWLDALGETEICCIRQNETDVSDRNKQKKDYKTFSFFLPIANNQVLSVLAFPNHWFRKEVSSSALSVAWRGKLITAPTLREPTINAHGSVLKKKPFALL